MKTRTQWLREKLRQVKRAEKPSDWLTITVPKFIRHEEHNSDGTVTQWTTQETTTRRMGLYSYEQTKPFKRVCGTMLRAIYASYFVSGRTQYIWWADDHWVTCKGYLDDAKIKAHVEGKGIYGVRAGDSMTNCVVVDLDLHNGSKDVIVRQLKAILEHFHGNRKTHYSVSPRGVHVIIILDQPTPIEKAHQWLRKELESIDTDEFEGTCPRPSNAPISEMEIKPGKKDGWRLPFARGRVTYIDGPLTDNDPKTFERYVLWLAKPTHAPLDQVFKFICGHLQEEKKEEKAEKKPRVSRKKEPKEKKQVVLGSLGRMKNSYRRTLVDFWTGKVTPADTLNTAIVLTARMLPFYYEDEEDAIEFLEELVEDLPDTAFSDRLSSGDMKEVSRIIRNTVRRVYNGNGGQPRIDESNWRLAETKKAWDRAGFSLINRSTWTRRSSSLGEYFNFSSAMQIKALDYLAGILKTDLQTCADVTRQIIRLAHKERQLPVAYVAAILKGYGICVRHDGRVNEYVNALRKMRWLVKLRESSADEHRARTYVAGEEFYPTAGEEAESSASSTSTGSHTHGTMLSVPFILRNQTLDEAMGWKSPLQSSQEGERPPPLPIFEPLECCV